MPAIRAFLLIVALCCLPGYAWAYYGSSNLSFSGYPDCRCYEPSPPYSNDKWAWDNFKSEVAEYERCVRNYVEAAANDQEDISEKANDAIRKYNNFINSLR